MDERDRQQSVTVDSLCSDKMVSYSHLLFYTKNCHDYFTGPLHHSRMTQTYNTSSQIGRGGCDILICFLNNLERTFSATVIQKPLAYTDGQTQLQLARICERKHQTQCTKVSHRHFFSGTTNGTNVGNSFSTANAMIHSIMSFQEL